MTTTLPEKHKQELKAHQDTQNKDKLYQATKADSNKPVKLPVAFEVQKLKMQHDNWLFDQQMEMIRRELKECINEKQN